MQNEPNFVGRPRLQGAKRAKRSQFRPDWAGPRQVKDAKRTQSPTDGSGRPSPGHPALRLPPVGCPGRNVQNEPNFGASAGWTQEAVVQTNPILSAVPIGRSAFPGSQSCETNPISARQGDLVDLESTAVCRPYATGPATGQPRCLGGRRGVDSVGNTGFSRVESSRRKAVLGSGSPTHRFASGSPSQRRFMAFGDHSERPAPMAK